MKGGGLQGVQEEGHLGAEVLVLSLEFGEEEALVIFGEVLGSREGLLQSKFEGARLLAKSALFVLGVVH